MAGNALEQFETNLQNCSRMGITIFKNFIWEGTFSDIQSEITVYGSAHVTVKLNFGPCIRRYTSTNEHFEYS